MSQNIKTFSIGVELRLGFIVLNYIIPNNTFSIKNMYVCLLIIYSICYRKRPTISNSKTFTKDKKVYWKYNNGSAVVIIDGESRLVNQTRVGILYLPSEYTG